MCDKSGRSTPAAAVLARVLVGRGMTRRLRRPEMELSWVQERKKKDDARRVRRLSRRGMTRVAGSGVRTACGSLSWRRKRLPTQKVSYGFNVTTKS